MNAPDNLKATKKTAQPIQLPLEQLAAPSSDLTPEAARKLLVNGTAAFEAAFPPECAREAVERALSSAAERADAVIRKFKEQGVTFPEGTAGAVLCGVQSAEEAEAAANEQAFAIDQDEGGVLAAEPDYVRARRIADGERGAFWGVPSQREIRVSTIANGNIEIEEVSPLGIDDDTRIIVAETNAVLLARSVLFAAGFSNILISTHTRGGYVDIEDGATAGQFEPMGEGH